MRDFMSQVGNPDRRGAFWLFLIGAFSMTRINVGGKIGISEFVILACSPFVFCKSLTIFRKEHFMFFLSLCFFWLANAVFSDWINATYPILALKGIASPVMVFANCMTLYVLLRKNPENMRFLLLGIAASAVISIFFFQKITDEELAMIGSSADAVSKVTNYKLFWGNMTLYWVGLSVAGWYLQTGLMVSLLSVFAIMVVYAVCGGRSATAAYFVSWFLILIGKKRLSSMRQVKRSIALIFLALVVSGLLLKTTYRYAATRGFMGEEERRKYERQTAGGSGGMLSMFLSGRSELFIATIAALDRPLIGHGSHAIDDRGYVAEFFAKYGSDVDRKLYYEAALNSLHKIPYHSQLATFWMWHGIGGLVFWCYALFLVVWTLTRGMAVFPPYFGYLALVLPITLWDIFFSPFGNRIPECAIFVACFLVRNMSRGVRYPLEMRRRSA